MPQSRVGPRTIAPPLEPGAPSDFELMKGIQAGDADALSQLYDRYNGILKALDAISDIDPSVAPSVIDGSAGVAPTPVPKGDFAPDIMVVLTDGVSNTGPDPLDAATTSFRSRIGARL